MIEVVRADYGNRAHAAAIVALLDVYACDPMGGAEPLDADVQARLVPALAALPQAFSFLAYQGDEPVGLANCFTGFATFAAQPVVNVHDIVVVPEAREQGVATALFEKIEAAAAELGACKVTLEVLSGNRPARSLYARLGYGHYPPDPDTGHALFWQKRLAA